MFGLVFYGFSGTGTDVQSSKRFGKSDKQLYICFRQAGPKGSIRPFLMELSDDKQIIEALRRGDESAFEALFKRFYPRLRSYAIRFTRDDDLTRDLVQDCFVRLWEKRALLNAISLTSLLFTMVRNACLNHLKHRSIVEKHRLTYLATIRGQERLYHVDFELDADRATLYEELQEHIGIVMERLPERSREVFALSRFEGLKNREIAERLGISQTAVEKHIARAIRTFSDYFKAIYSSDLYIMVMTWVIVNYLDR